MGRSRASASRRRRSGWGRSRRADRERDAGAGWEPALPEACSWREWVERARCGGRLGAGTSAGLADDARAALEAAGRASAVDDDAGLGARRDRALLQHAVDVAGVAHELGAAFARVGEAVEQQLEQRLLGVA